MLLRRALPATFFALFFVPGACGTGTREPGDPDARPLDHGQRHTSGTMSLPPLDLRLELPARVSRGARIPIRLTLENRGDEPVEVGLGGRPPAFDFVVARQDGTVVWSRLHEQAIAAILQPRRIAPGEALHFEDTWNQRDNRRRQVSPGTYSVVGVLHVVDAPGGLRTGAGQVTILP